MNDLKDIPTFILIEMCKGHWNLYPVPIQAEYVSKEMKQWCEDAKNTMIENLKKELDRRAEEFKPKPVHEPKHLLQAYVDYIRKMWSQE